MRSTGNSPTAARQTRPPRWRRGGGLVTRYGRGKSRAAGTVTRFGSAVYVPFELATFAPQTPKLSKRGLRPTLWTPRFSCAPEPLSLRFLDGSLVPANRLHANSQWPPDSTGE